MSTPLRQRWNTREGRTLPPRFGITALFVIFLSGCVTATIPGPTTLAREVIPPELAHEYPTVVVEGVDIPQRVGSLFAFLALPVGSIMVTEPKHLVEDSVTRAIITAGEKLPIEYLSLNNTDLQITAYDLLITRRIVCSVASTIQMSPYPESTRAQTIAVTTSLGRFRSLAFSAQITEVTKECLRQFGAEVIRKVTDRVQIGGYP